MEISAGALQAITTSFQTRFKNAYMASKAATSYEKISTLIPSKTDRETYFLDGDVPQLTEWVGERTIRELAEYDWSIKNRKFQAGIKLKRDHIEDDQIGLFADRAAGLGDSAERHPDSLIVNLLETGDTQFCYDGQHFFDTTHATGSSGTWSNKGTTALTLDAAGIAAITTARTAMAAIKSDTGFKLNIRPDLMIVPPSLESIAVPLSKNETIYVGGTTAITNPWAGTFSVLVVPTLNDTNNWYFVDSSKPMKPFIFQTRRAISMKAMVNPMDESVFWREEFLWVVDYRGNAGYALPQLIYGAIVP